MIIILVIIVVIVTVVGYACLVLGSRADDQMERFNIGGKK